MPSTRTFGTGIAEQSSTVGTALYQLDGPLEGYRAFSDEYILNDAPYYAVRNASETKYEYNKGTTVYTPGGPSTLTRAVWLSSSANAAIAWDASDLPLTIYVPTSGEVMEGMVTGFLATARNSLIRFGTWWKKNDQGSGIHSLKLWDGGVDIHLGIADTNTHIFVPGLQRGQIFGLNTSNSVGDTAHDILIGTGDTRDSTNASDIHLASALIKQIDATWAAGTNAGGMASGVSLAAGTTYHLFLAVINGVVDAFWDTSATAAHKPAGTTTFRRIWSNVTIASAATIRQYTQFGDKCIWTISQMTTSGNGDFPVLPMATATFGLWTCGAGTVPQGIIVKLQVQGYLVGSSGGWAVGLYDAQMSATGASNIGYQWTLQGSNQTGGYTEIWTNVSGQIGAFYVGPIAQIWFQIPGYYDRRGQDD